MACMATAITFRAAFSSGLKRQSFTKLTGTGPKIVILVEVRPSFTVERRATAITAPQCGTATVGTLDIHERQLHRQAGHARPNSSRAMGKSLLLQQSLHPFLPPPAEQLARDEMR